MEYNLKDNLKFIKEKNCLIIKTEGNRNIIMPDKIANLIFDNNKE